MESIKDDASLSENNAAIGDFVAEWGLSILVETDETKVLLDTGQWHSCIPHADLLGIKLGVIDEIALSYSHFDHTGTVVEL